MQACRRWFSMLGAALIAWPAMAASVGAVTGAAPGGVAGSAVAPATSAWRCGAEGRVYSDTPCAGGREIELPAPRPATDVRAAERLAQRDATLAERLRREREAREAAAIAASAQPVSLGPVRSATPGPGAKRSTRLERRGLAADQRQQALPQATVPKLNKPQRPPQRAPGRDAEARTWRAIAPASPRTPG